MTPAATAGQDVGRKVLAAPDPLHGHERRDASRERERVARDTHRSASIGESETLRCSALGGC